MGVCASPRIPRRGACCVCVGRCPALGGVAASVCPGGCVPFVRPLRELGPRVPVRRGGGHCVRIPLQPRAPVSVRAWVTPARRACTRPWVSSWSPLCRWPVFWEAAWALTASVGGLPFVTVPSGARVLSARGRSCCGRDPRLAHPPRKCASSRGCGIGPVACMISCAGMRSRVFVSALARALACLRSSRSRHLCGEKGSQSRAGPVRRGLTREGDATPALPLRGSFAEPPPSPERQREGGGHPRVWRPPALQCRRRHFGQWSHTVLGTE